MDKLDGKIAVITGGSSGIGLATAKEFVREGAYVFITARNQRGLDFAVAAIGKHVTAVQGDVANRADLDRLYERVVIEKGRVDISRGTVGLSGRGCKSGDVSGVGRQQIYSGCRTTRRRRNG